MCLRKRKRLVSFKSNTSQGDKSVVIRRIREEFRDRLIDDVACEIVLQTKNYEVDDFMEVRNEDPINDKAALEFFVERNDVSL